MLPQFDGFGLGLRKPHYQSFVTGSVDVDFIEVVSENFMVAGGKPLHVIEAVRSHYRARTAWQPDDSAAVD